MCDKLMFFSIAESGLKTGRKDNGNLKSDLLAKIVQFLFNYCVSI